MNINNMLAYIFFFPFVKTLFAALYLTGVSVLAGFWGQYFIRKLIKILGRASIIVFILSGVIIASALTMGNNTNLS